MQLHDNHSYRARTVVCDALPERVDCCFKNWNFVSFEELTASPCSKTTNRLFASTKNGTCLASLTSQSIITTFGTSHSQSVRIKERSSKRPLVVKEIPFRHNNKKWVENSE